MLGRSISAADPSFARDNYNYGAPLFFDKTSSPPLWLAPLSRSGETGVRSLSRPKKPKFLASAYTVETESDFRCSSPICTKPLALIHVIAVLGPCNL
jgi:hypothetical protein